MNPKPQTNAELANDLLASLWAKISADPAYIPTEFELMRIQKEAEKGRKNDPCLAYMVLGGVATFKGDRALMEKHFANVFNLQPDATLLANIHRNYAIFLGRFGDLPSSLIKLRRAHELQPYDTVYLQLLIYNCLAIGRFREAQSMLERLLKLKPSDTLFESQELAKIVSLMEEKGLSDDEVAAETSLATELLVTKKIVVSRWDLSLDETEGEGVVYIFYDIQISPEASADLNWELSGLQAQCLPDNLLVSSVVVTGYSGILES